MNKKLLAGILLLAAAAGVAVLFGMQGLSGTPEIVKIYYGSEKKGLLHDQELIEHLEKEYHLTVDGSKMGSLEMSQASLDGVDGVWPSSELAALVFKERKPGLALKQSNIFNTPIVFYSWPEITRALMDQGVVEKRQDLYFVVDTRKYLDMVQEGRTWKSLSLPRQNGVISILSTDPTKSNSGFLVSGLISVILNNGAMVNDGNVQDVLPRVLDIYKHMGFMENSTGILFDKYIKQGQGAFPLIAAYENLLIEFYNAYPSYQGQIKKLVRVLIPEPTVWSEHPFLALSEKGERLLAALQDPVVQELAWERYGFRSGVMGINNDPAILKQVGLPERIDSVTPLPAPEIMERILGALE